MPFAREIELLKLLAAGERQRVASCVLSREVDFQALADFLERQQLGLYFSRKLEALQLGKLFPAGFREKLHWQRDAQNQKREALVAALAALHGEFATAGVDFILTKGLHLAARYWGGVENRFTWDLDLLVEPENLDSAVRVLQQAGYRTAHASVLASRLLHRFSHAQEFIGQGVAVDLHWIFRPRPGHRVDYAAIWQRRGTWVFNGVPYPVLSGEDTLLMLLLGIAEDVERAEPNYRKFWDIYLMLCAGVVADWDAFFQTAQQQGVGRIVVATLALTCHALRCGDAFPALQRALGHWSQAVPCSERELQALLERRSRHPANRLWVARLQPVSTAYYLAWWTLTAPMRYLVWRW
jgi:hypothetical protein